MKVISSKMKISNREYCCVYGCKSRASENREISFHKFPKEGKCTVEVTNKFGTIEKIDKRKAWIMAIRTGKAVTSRMKICSLHFNASDYVFSELEYQRPRLKKTAVPTLQRPMQKVVSTASKGGAQRVVKREAKKANKKEKEETVEDTDEAVAIDINDVGVDSAGNNETLSIADEEKIKMEICIDSLESARNAVEGGASRLEVCSALSEGGLTPSPGLIQQIRSFTTIPLYAMIRIRCGDFVYSPEEINAMLHDLKILKDHDVNGFVFGALTADCEIDIIACEKIVSAARPLPVTFSRAFDLTTDPVKSMELLADLGFQRILTSGQKNTALEGLKLIKELLLKAQKIVIMPGAGITKDNIRKIMKSGAKEFHASAKKRKMVVHGANRVRMSANEDDFVNVTDKELVEELVEIIKKECSITS